MSLIKSKEEIETLREGGKRLSMVLAQVMQAARAGVSTLSLDELAERLIREDGDEPAFKGYRPDGARFPYPATLCVSINDEIVHGVPRGDRVLKEGDIVSLDIGSIHKGLITDMAVTVPVGEISFEDRKLIDATRGALHVATRAVRAGGHIGDIGEAIEKYVDSRYFIVEGLGGHGVGHEVHEKPFIANFGKAGTGPGLVSGMVIAIEPMLALGSELIEQSRDGFTYVTRDGSHSAHFEATLAVTENGADILTPVINF